MINAQSGYLNILITNNNNNLCIYKYLDYNLK